MDFVQFCHRYDVLWPAGIAHLPSTVPFSSLTIRYINDTFAVEASGDSYCFELCELRAIFPVLSCFPNNGENFDNISVSSESSYASDTSEDEDAKDEGVNFCSMFEFGDLEDAEK